MTAVDDSIHQGTAGRSATVTASLANGHGAGSVTGVALTLTDDETAPGAAMALNPASVTENGGVATVTATLSHPSAAPTTLTVSASPVSPAAAGDFTLSSANMLTVAAGSTTSAGTVTVTANDNRVDAADKSVTVTASLANGRGTGAVTAATLTLTDDDTAAIVASRTSGLATTEDGGTDTFTVTLATRPTGDVRIDVASSDTAQGTVMPATLTFTAGDWSTAQTVTLTGVNDSPPAADGSQTYDVTLTIDQTNTADAKYDALSAVTVRAVNRDDEFGLNVSAVTGQATEGGGTATFTVALRTQPMAAVTVTVASRDPSEGRVAPSTLTFTGGATGNWETAQTVTVTGVDDNLHDGNVAWQVRLDTSSGDGDYDALAHVDVAVTTTDATPPTVTLMLDPASIPENGGVSTVTATLSHRSVANTTVTVTASPVAPGDGGRLHAEPVGQHARHRGREHLERRDGDDRGEDQQRGFGGQGGDGLGERGERPGDGGRDAGVDGGDAGDADDRGRRREGSDVRSGDGVGSGGHDRDVHDRADQYAHRDRDGLGLAAGRRRPDGISLPPDVRAFGMGRAADGDGAGGGRTRTSLPTRRR